MASRKAYDTTKAGTLNCDVIGDLSSANAVVLTIHDLGCNSMSWEYFVNHKSMVEITKRVTWVHVNLPGQESGAATLPKDYKYPSMDDLAEAIGEVCADIHCPVIGLGEGAGANILARWALTAPKQLHGAILIHCTSTTAGYLESLKDKVINWKLMGGMNPTAENYLIMHRFGDFTHASNAEQVKKVVDEFHTRLNTNMNSANISGYINSFVNRTSIAEKMSALQIRILILTGAKANHNHTVHTFYNATMRSVPNKQLVEFVEIADVANVVEGAPDRLAEGMQFFMQGCGVLGGVPMPHVGSTGKTGTTMKQMDKSDL